MKIMRTISASIAAFAVLAATAFGQMGKGTMGGMQGEGPELPQTMSQDMMQNMTGVMTQMSEMMRKLSHPMGHMTVTEHAKMQDMAKVMREMAVAMTDLSLQMEKGKMDKATADRLQKEITAMKKTLEELKKKGQ
jgi:hypothetical protein